MLLFVSSSLTTTVSLPGMHLSIVSLDKRYTYRPTVSQIMIQDTVLKPYLDTRYIFRISDTYLSTFISDTTQHWTGCRQLWALEQVPSRLKTVYFFRSLQSCTLNCDIRLHVVVACLSSKTSRTYSAFCVFWNCLLHECHIYFNILMCHRQLIFSEFRARSDRSSRIRILRILRIFKIREFLRILKHEANFILFYMFEFWRIKVLHFHRVQNKTFAISLSSLRNYFMYAISSQSRSTVPSSRELMQLGISQSQHSLVAVLQLHQNNQSNGPIAPICPLKILQILTNFKFSN